MFPNFQVGFPWLILRVSLISEACGELCGIWVRIWGEEGMGLCCCPSGWCSHCPSSGPWRLVLSLLLLTEGSYMPGCIIDPSAWETFGFSSSHASLGWLGPEAVLGFFPILCLCNDGHQGAPNALPSPGSTQAGKVKSIGPEILTQTSLVSSHCPLSLACLVAWGLLRLKAYDPSKFICWSPISQRDCIWKVRWGHEHGALMMSLMPL